MASSSLLLVVAGPTAAGKTDLAVRLAQHLGGEIISADSRQIYQRLEIGTGKPSAEQFAAVRHHCVSRVSPEVALTAEQYAEMADAAADEIQRQGKVCLVVGGTGLWLRAFIDGLAPVPAADPMLRKRLQAQARSEGLASLHRKLREVDPSSAARIAENDAIRIIRSLEIWLQTGQTATAWRGQPSGRPAKPSLWVGLTRPREILYRRAEARIDAWLAEGWLEEVQRLVAGGVPREAPAFHAIGYSYLAGHLAGSLDWPRTVALMKRDTRRYIKRQLTWFHAEPRMHWFDLEAGEDRALHDILDLFHAANRQGATSA